MQRVSALIFENSNRGKASEVVPRVKVNGCY
jgi:hypothetical protein